MADRLDIDLGDVDRREVGRREIGRGFDSALTDAGYILHSTVRTECAPEGLNDVAIRSLRDKNYRLVVFPSDLLDFRTRGDCGSHCISDSHEVFTSYREGDVSSEFNHQVNADEIYRPQGFRVVGIHGEDIEFPRALMDTAAAFAEGRYSDVRVVSSRFVGLQLFSETDSLWTPSKPSHIFYAKPDSDGNFMTREGDQRIRGYHGEGFREIGSPQIVENHFLESYDADE